ncbi:hypothetical protein KKG55_06415 [Candidatus Micrarchaeota archaeon]|nr:hypothetical protein [Candidatus Micrarchaeota archaeon]MBU1887351.1 hypothetical protein [Candidatus Micrarchaeota archaeon]
MVVVARRIVYETTNDVKRMLTSGQIARAIIDEVRNDRTKTRYKHSWSSSSESSNIHEI